MQYDALFTQIIKSAEAAKALNPVAFDLHERFNYAETAIIISGRSDRHAIGITDRILKDTRDNLKVKPSFIDGYREGHWIILDFFDVIVHVFYQPQREVYDLETLYKKCKQLDLDELIKSVQEEQEVVAQPST